MLKVSWKTVEEVLKMWTVVRENKERTALCHKQTALLILKVKDLKLRNNF